MKNTLQPEIDISEFDDTFNFKEDFKSFFSEGLINIKDPSKSVLKADYFANKFLNNPFK